VASKWRGDHADDEVRAEEHLEHLGAAFLGDLLEGAAEVLGLHRVFGADAAQELGAKLGMPVECSTSPSVRRRRSGACRGWGCR
jgi:hypothetical protein